MPLQRRKLIKRLEQVGWRLLRNGANHDVYTDGKQMEPIPRHNEIYRFQLKIAKLAFPLRGRWRAKRDG